jgi:tetratricopeptide (TPR) repeat protein
MSLLIKALDKAEKAQEEQQKLQKSTRRQASNIANESGDSQADDVLRLELEQPSPSSEQVKYADDSEDFNIARAANVFEAKQMARAGVPPLAWIAGFGFLTLLGVGYYFYYQLNQIQAPAIVVDQRLSQANQPVPTTFPQNDTPQDDVQITGLPQAPIDAVKHDDVQLDSSTAKSSLAPTEDMLKLDVSKSAKLTNEEEVVAPAKIQKSIEEPSNVANHSTMAYGMPVASDSVSVQISKSKTEQGVNPTLMSAYNAYNAGKDTEAQALYKNVLQKDIRNVDALLGMGAIAERQGRLNDAYGWYGKVLEVEPRNATALAAYYDIEQGGQGKEQKLKNLIAKNANDYNAHADLGAYYAEQNRWSDAQQSYFEAYRLNATADNAFNLAVSLDQMHKPKLALPYYQQALALTHKSPTHSLDESVLQARIQAIQEK